MISILGKRKLRLKEVKTCIGSVSSKFRGSILVLSDAQIYVPNHSAIFVIKIYAERGGKKKTQHLSNFTLIVYAVFWSGKYQSVSTGTLILKESQRERLISVIPATVFQVIADNANWGSWLLQLLLMIKWNIININLAVCSVWGVMKDITLLLK